MKLLFTFLLFTIYCSGSIALGQFQTVWVDDLESNLGWTFIDGNNTNHFVINTCAGNSSLGVGDSQSLYVAPKTSISNGCNAGSNLSYTYLPNTNGSDSIVAFKAVPYTNCADNLFVTFDYKIQTNDVNDKASLVYRLLPTDAWTEVATFTTSTTSFSSANYSLPSSLNGQSFQIGFRFIFNDNTVSGIPLAIDNIKIQGSDAVKPSISCPIYDSLFADVSCGAILPDLTGLVTASDNCTSSAGLSFSQNPASGTAVYNGDSIAITVYDLSNNANTCKIAVAIVDTLSPILTCNDSLILSINSTCQYIVPDLSSNVLTATDNCSTNFTYSQSISIGTATSGIQIATIYVYDQQGNFGQCPIFLLPLDTISPSVICPTDKILSNGSCSYTVQDYQNEVVANDNCTISSLLQIPAAGQTMNVGNHVYKFVVKDVMGNASECSFNVDVKENVAPVITNCPADITTCNPIVTFADILATDNCGVSVIKTDNTHLFSGDTFPVGTTHLQYEAVDSSRNTTTCNFSITILPPADIPQLINDTLVLCNQDSVLIHAVSVNAGTGYWSVTASSGLTLVTPNQSTTMIKGLKNGNNTVTWHTTSTACGEKIKNMSIINYALPTVANAILDTLYKCNNTSVLLTGVSPLIGSSLWTCADSNVIISNKQSHNAFADSLVGGWYTFYYSISNGICPTSMDSLVVFKMSQPKILNMNDTTIICDKVNLKLNGSAPVAGADVSWNFAKGTGKFTDETSAETVLLDYSLGYNIILYSTYHPVCGILNDTLNLHFKGCNEEGEFIIPTMITPNQDGKNDEFIIDGLHAAYPECTVTIVNRWGSIVFKSNGYEKPWNGTFKDKPLPIGTYYYVIELNEGNKKPLTGPISILR